VAFSGAEPVRPETLDGFERRFSASGFQRSSWLPVYGLAEATLFVSGGPRGQEPVERAVNPGVLESGRVTDGTRRLVGCGQLGVGVDVRIIGPDGAKLPADGVGEIVVQGPSVASGYWRDPASTEAAFGRVVPGESGTWLRTGDLGFLSGGALYVTGRAKDLLIVRGRNLYPQDLENTAQSAHPAVRGGCVVAFGDVRDGEERVGLAAEIDPGRATDGPQAVADAIRAALADHHDVLVDPVLLVEPRGLPKTSSGKVQRGATRDAWKDGSLAILHASQQAPVAPRSPEGADPRPGPDPILAGLVREVAAWSGQPERAVDVDAPLSALGLDSLRLVELAQAAEELSGARVQMAAVYIK
jgi:acyl-CoA synthetase (AMP-forming)/AMP-acid ligase II/acyl carrier protein